MAGMPVLPQPLNPEPITLSGAVSSSPLDMCLCTPAAPHRAPTHYWLLVVRRGKAPAHQRHCHRSVSTSKHCRERFARRHDRTLLPQVGECIGQYWRPNFDHHMYPYLPAHVTRPKEVRKLYVVPLQEKAFFEVRLGQKMRLLDRPYCTPTASRLSARIFSLF